MAQVADPEEGLRVETASRLEWDRDRWLRRPLDAAVSPVKADSDFMSKLLFLLRKVGCPVYPGGLVHPGRWYILVPLAQSDAPGVTAAFTIASPAAASRPCNRPSASVCCFPCRRTLLS